MTPPVPPSTLPVPLSRRRRVAIWALVVVASVIGLVSTLTVWTKRQLLDNEAWAKSSEELIRDPEIRSALSVYLVNELYDNVDVAATLEERLPPDLQPLAGPLAGALRQPTTNGVEFLLGRPRVQQLWINASTLAHQKAIAVLKDETGFGISTGEGVVTLDLRELVRQLGIDLGLPAAVVDRLPPDAGVITVLESDQLSAAQRAVRAIEVLSVWLGVLVLGLFALAVYLARGMRRETLRNIGWAFVLVGLRRARRPPGNRQLRDRGAHASREPGRGPARLADLELDPRRDRPRGRRLRPRDRARHDARRADRGRDGRPPLDRPRPQRPPGRRVELHGRGVPAARALGADARAAHVVGDPDPRRADRRGRRGAAPADAGGVPRRASAPARDAATPNAGARGEPLGRGGARRLNELRDAGVISGDEFDRAKSAALG